MDKVNVKSGNLLLATGGNDPEDLVLHQAGVEIMTVAEVQAVQAQPLNNPPVLTVDSDLKI